MSTEVKQKRWRSWVDSITKDYNFFEMLMQEDRKKILFALIAGLFAAMVIAADTNVIKNFLPEVQGVEKAVSNIVVSVSYGLLGALMGTITMFVVNKLVGKKIDSNYTTERWVSWKYQLYAMGTGICGAIYTVSYLFLIKAYDGTVIVIALSNVFVLYLVLFERESKLSTKVTLPLTLLVIVGATMVGYDPDAESGLALFPVLVLLTTAVLPAFAFVMEHKATNVGTELQGHSNPNLLFWRFLWLTVSMFVLLVPISFFAPWGENVWNYFTHDISWLSISSPLPWIFLVMVFVYAMMFFRFKALEDNSYSLTALAESSKSAYAVLLVWFLSIVVPGNTYKAPETLGTFLINLLGAFLVAGATFPLIYLMKKKAEKNS